MAKKKSKEVDGGLNVSQVGWDENTRLIGTPTMILLPAKHYCFKIVNKKYKITIPRKGAYCDFDKEIYSKEDGEFNVFDSEKNVVHLPSISKVLFCVKKYPDLKANQVFAPMTLIIKDEEVDIVGQIIDMLDPLSPDDNL